MKDKIKYSSLLPVRMGMVEDMELFIPINGFEKNAGVAVEFVRRAAIYRGLSKVLMNLLNGKYDDLG